jgi:hypothetical protein
MKKYVVTALISMAIANFAQAQDLDLNSLLGTKKHKKRNADSTQTQSTSLGSLGSGDIAAGLKEALSDGVQKGTAQLSAVNGFFADAAVKVLMPPEAAKVESTLRSIGMGKQVDDAILSMNRAAEDATKSAAPIFLNAITKMTIGDAIGILKGTDTAATHYLRISTTDPLTTAFSPVIKTSLDKVDATKYWATLFNAYNQIPFVDKVNPDLTAYVTSKALSGIFYEIALEEQNIRKNPIARTTDLLKQVFGAL